MIYKGYLKLSLLGAAAILVGCSKTEDNGRPQMPPTGVSYVTVKEEPLKIQSQLKGRLVAIEEAEVRPQITGIIESIKIKDGQEVKKGDILYKVDPAQYQAAYNQAVASYNTVKADLHSANLKALRYEELLKSNAVPVQDVDDAKAAYQKLLATLEERKAAVDLAKINLNYTDIKAPIDGKIGISSVTNGALVTANQVNSINTITKLDPIYLDVNQQSQEFIDMMSLSKDLKSKEIPVEIRMTEKSDPILGYVSSSEIKVDPQTDTVKLRAKFENKEKSLLPGMYGYATVTYGVIENGIKVPLQTIVRNTDGSSSVYIVGEGNKIEKVNVELLKNKGVDAIINSGLKNGDKVVIEGLDKIKAGDIVNPTEKK